LRKFGLNIHQTIVQMKTVVPYNDISEALKKLVVWPKDSKGKPLDRVVYELTRKEKVVEWTPNEERINVDAHPSVMVPNMDTILDEAQGEYIQLAYYKTIRPPAPGSSESPTPALLPIDFTPDNRGFLYVPYKGGERLFQFLEITNSNEDCVNPAHERNAMGYLFRRVKPELTAEMQIDRTGEIFRVGGIIMVMELDKLRSLAPKLGLDATVEPQQLRHSILQAVQTDPYRVNNLLDTELSKVEGEVRQALGRKIIEFDEQLQSFVMYEDRSLLATIPSGTVDKTDALVTFLASGNTGISIRDKIRAALAGKKNAKLHAQPAEEQFLDDEEEAPAPPRKAVASKKPAAKAAAAPKKAPVGKRKEAPAPAPAPVPAPTSVPADNGDTY
jgi:hypothetical protein